MPVELRSRVAHPGYFSNIPADMLSTISLLVVVSLIVQSVNWFGINLLRLIACCRLLLSTQALLEKLYHGVAW
jgi:hypothetical protein